MCFVLFFCLFFVSSFACIHWYPLLLHLATKQSFISCGWGKDEFGLNGHGRYGAEREGSHGGQRRLVTGFYPVLSHWECRLPASTVGDFAIPLQPIKSIVPCFMEGVRGRTRSLFRTALWTLRLFDRVTEAVL